MFVIAKTYSASPISVDRLTGLRRNILNAMAAFALLLLVGGCGTFVGVEAAQLSTARLTPYVPAKPSPVIPFNPTLETVTVEQAEKWSRSGQTWIAMPNSDLLSLEAWMIQVSANQRAWASIYQFLLQRSKDATKDKKP